MKAAIYSRTTYVESDGIEKDIELGKRWLGQQGHDFAVSFADKGYSANDPNRPQLNALLEAAAEHQFDVVVVLVALTLASNVGVLEMILVRLAEHGVRVFTVAGRELCPPGMDNEAHSAIAADAWPYLRLVPKANSGVN